MSQAVRLIMVLGLPILGLSAVSAQSVPELKTLMTERGKLIVQDDFKKPLGSAWFGAKGKWEIVDGVLRAAEVPADMHGAVRRQALNLNSVIIQYDFKLDGTRQTTLSINGAKGHVCRVLIRPTGFTVQKDKDKSVSDSKAVALDSCQTAIKPGAWHTMLVEIHGQEMLACLDGKHVAFGSHSGIDVKKTNFGLTVGGESASFRNLRVWEGSPNSSWATTKTKLLNERAKTASK
jgi:hypothetical protein